MRLAVRRLVRDRLADLLDAARALTLRDGFLLRRFADRAGRAACPGSLPLALLTNSVVVLAMWPKVEPMAFATSVNNPSSLWSLSIIGHLFRGTLNNTCSRLIQLAELNSKSMRVALARRAPERRCLVHLYSENGTATIPEPT